MRHSPVEGSDEQSRLEGKGCRRVHGCACPSSVCPVKAARKLVDKARSRGNQEALVVTLGGGNVRKGTMVAEIVNLAAATGSPTGKYTGHSLRVTGAQRMASAGVELEKIKVFGRWTSNEALRYTREALVNRLNVGTAAAVEQSLGSAKGTPGACVESLPAVSSDRRRKVRMRAWPQSDLCRRG